MHLGIDLGTSSLKASLFSDTGEHLRAWRVGLPVSRVSGRRVELDPLSWWQALQEVIAECPSVQSLAVSGLTNTHVLIDEDGDPVGPAIGWADTRTLDLASGEPATSVLARLEWWERFEPETLTRSASLLFAKDFLIRRLSGVSVGDTVTWGRWVDGSRWSAALPARFHRLLPQLVEPGQSLGGDPTVVVGVPDSLAAAIGAGAVHRGDTWVVAGSSETVGVWIPPGSQVRASVRLQMWGNDLVLDASSVGGVTHTWAERVWPSAEPLAARCDAVLDRGVNAVTPIFLPHVFGERAPGWDPTARGALVGLVGETDVRDIWAAVTESIAFVQRQMIEQLRDEAEPCRRLVLTGGPAVGRSRAQLLADVTGESVLVPEDVESGTRGTAMLAMAGFLGCPVAEAMERLASPLRTVPPRAEYSVVFGKRYKQFRELTEVVRHRY